MQIPSVQITHSSVAGSVPDAADLDIGALAVNVADGLLFTKDYASTVKLISGDAGNGTVASSSTVNLDAILASVIDVTGTTTITAITLAAGKTRILRFAGALTLTNGANLVLLGGANVTTAAGDFAVMRGFAGGVVRCMSYSYGTSGPGSFTTLKASEDVAIAATKKIYLDGVAATGDTYLVESSANTVDLYVGGVNIGKFTSTSLALKGSVSINEDGAGTKVLSLRSNYAGLGPAINVTTSDPLLILTSGTQRVSIDATRLAVTGGLTCSSSFGCNGATAQTPFAVGSSSYDLTTVIALANSLRNALINNGIAS